MFHPKSGIVRSWAFSRIFFRGELRSEMSYLGQDKNERSFKTPAALSSRHFIRMDWSKNQTDQNAREIHRAFNHQFVEIGKFVTHIFIFFYISMIAADVITKKWDFNILIVYLIDCLFLVFTNFSSSFLTSMTRVNFLS